MHAILMAGAVVAASGAAALADCGQGENFLSCDVADTGRVLSVCLHQGSAVYAYGRPGAVPELTLRQDLAGLDHQRVPGSGDDLVTFRSGPFAYRIAAGRREGREFAGLTVMRDGAEVTRLACIPDSIRRDPDRLPSPDPGPPCEAQSNVDTCWSRGVEAQQNGQPLIALRQYDRSCDAGFQLGGCYEAGKIYLADPGLRNDIAAEDRLVQVCDSDDIGIGPYACKFLGVLYRDGMAEQRSELAPERLAQACFLHNPDMFIDGQGCEFLADGMARAGRPYLAYLGYAMGCTDGMPGLCDKARGIYRPDAPWVAECEAQLDGRPPAQDCAGLAGYDGLDDFDTRQDYRRQLIGLYRNALIADR